MKTLKKIFQAALVAILSLTACALPSWVSSVEADAKVAAPIAASLIDVIDPSLAPIVTLVETGFGALVKTLDDYKASPTGTNLQAVESAFNAVSANVAQLETAAQIKDPATRATVTAVVQLLGQPPKAPLGARAPARGRSARRITGRKGIPRVTGNGGARLCQLLRGREMNKSGAATRKRRTSNYTVLTKVAKMDGAFPGLATEARMLLDRGVSTRRAAAILHGHYPEAGVSASNLAHFRSSRWIPLKQKCAEKFAHLQALFEEAGGNYGLDLAAFAKLGEMLDSASFKEANDIRLTVVKIRAQDLKEQEFDLKRQMGGEDSEAATESDAADDDARTKEVMNKVRAIFALPALPEGKAEAAPVEPQESSPP